MKFSIKDFFSKCDQIRSFQRIWSHFLKKSLMENFIFYAVYVRLQPGQNEASTPFLYKKHHFLHFWGKALDEFFLLFPKMALKRHSDFFNDPIWYLD